MIQSFDLRRASTSHPDEPSPSSQTVPMRFAAFLVMSAIWGLTWLPMKSAALVVPPIFLAAVRFLVAGALFYAYLAARRIPLAPPNPVRLVAASLLTTTGCYAFVFWGVARVPSGLSAIVNLSLIPVFTIVIGALHGEERITRRRIAAVGLGIVGLVLLFWTRQAGGQEGVSVALGIAAIVIGTLCYSWGSVISRPLVAETPPVALAFWQVTIGGVLLLPISFIIEGYDPSRVSTFWTDGRAAFGLGFLVIAGSLMAFSIYLWLIREWGAFRAGLYAFVSPIVAVSVGVVWAGEPFGWPETAGMAVMLAATGLVIRREPVTP